VASYQWLNCRGEGIGRVEPQLFVQPPSNSLSDTHSRLFRSRLASRGEGGTDHPSSFLTIQTLPRTKLHDSRVIFACDHKARTVRHDSRKIRYSPSASSTNTHTHTHTRTHTYYAGHLIELDICICDTCKNNVKRIMLKNLNSWGIRRLQPPKWRPWIGIPSDLILVCYDFTLKGLYLHSPVRHLTNSLLSYSDADECGWHSNFGRTQQHNQRAICSR